MFDILSKLIKQYINDNMLTDHLVRIWIYKKTCVVADFDYKSIRFGFNFTPLGNEVVSVDLIKRPYSSQFSVTENRKKKELIAEAACIDEALALFHSRLERIFLSFSEYNRSTSGSLSSVYNKVEMDPAGDFADIAPRLRVGILTLPLNHNIGGNIQAYALYTILKDLGHSPTLIDRRHPEKLPEVIASSAHLLETHPRKAKSGGLQRRSPNATFIDSNITSISQPIFTESQLSDIIEKHNFDAIIVGSDQVWRPKYAKSLLMDFFFGFLPSDNNKIRRISYAASFGASDWEFSEEDTNLALGFIGQFDAVSVREDSGVVMCRDKLGVDAFHVLDPTLLLPLDHYATQFSLKQRHSGADFILAYILDANQDKSDLINLASKHLCLPVIRAGRKSASKGSTVESWLTSFFNSKFVVTDSFHGVVFSILFNKQFVAYGNPARGIARFTSILKIFGLEDRLLLSPDDINLEKMMSPIDWTMINSLLAARRADSLKFLKLALATKDNFERASSIKTEVPVKLEQSAGPFSGQKCEPLNVFCTGCGVCISESNGTLRMEWSDDGFLVPVAAKGKVKSESIRVCPFNPAPEDVVKDEDALADIFLSDTSKFDPRAGRFENSYIGYSKRFRLTSSSGGIATYVFDKLLSLGIVDFLFVVMADEHGRYKYRVATRADDIIATSKTRYYPVSLNELFDVIDRTDGRFALSGVACFVKAVRLKQYYNPEYRRKIPFVLGIICGGLKSRNYTDFLAGSSGINGSYTAPEYRLKNPKSTALDYSFSALDIRSNRFYLKMKSVGDMWGTGLFKSKACDFCTDVLTELSDISVGDAWLPKYKRDGLGNSVIITRCEVADRIIRDGIASGELITEEASVSDMVHSQSGGFRHKQKAIGFRLWMMKYSGSINIPFIRKRILCRVSYVDALVQLYRERARSKSLRYWRESRNAAVFVRRMYASLEGLKMTKAKDDREPTAIDQPFARWFFTKMRQQNLGFQEIRDALQAKSSDSEL